MASDGNDAPDSHATAPAPCELHIALVIPHQKFFEYLADKAFVIQPPYWKGTVKLHIIPNNPKSRWNQVDWQIRQALVETGLADPDQVEFSPPVELTLGWPKDDEPA